MFCQVLHGAAGFRQNETYHVARVKVVEWANEQQNLTSTCAKLIFPWADEQLRLVRDAQKDADKKRAHEFAGRVRFLEFLIRGREYLFVVRSNHCRRPVYVFSLTCLHVSIVELRQSVLSNPDPALNNCAKDLFDRERAGKWAVKPLVSHTPEFNTHAKPIATLLLSEH